MIEWVTNILENPVENWLLLLAVAVGLVVTIIKRADLVSKKVLPLVSVIVGIAFGAFVAAITAHTVVLGGFYGLLAGLVASGGYDFIIVIHGIANGKIKDWDQIIDVLDDGELNGSNKK